MNNIDSFAIEELQARLKKQGVDAETLPTVIYARKSTKDESNVSISSQIRACIDYIESNDKLELIKIYSEENVTGYNMKRKQFNALLSEVEKGKIRVIVAYCLDRVSRNVSDGAELDRKLDEAGVLLLYATQSFERNAEGNFTKNILRAVAQRQPENTAENVIKTMIDKAIICKHNGGVVPYGYKVINERYVIDENEAPAVKMMFKGVLSGQTIPEIIETLTNNGYRTRADKPFSPQTVHRMLRSVKYKGTYLFNREDVKRSKGRPLKKKYDEVRINGGIPQIIGEEVFDKVQEKLCKKTMKSSPLAKEPYALTGLLKCGCCGNSMHGYASIGGHSKKRYTNYTCKGGKIRNSCNFTVRQEYLERATAEYLADILNKLKKNEIVQASAFYETKNAWEKEFNALKSDLVAREREVKKMIKSLANSTDDTVSKIISNQIKEMNEIITNKTARKNLLATKMSDLEKAIIENMSNALITAEEILEDKELFKRVLTLLVKDITITKENVIINLNDLT